VKAEGGTDLATAGGEVGDHGNRSGRGLTQCLLRIVADIYDDA
jgi:hypothetical protein